MSAPYRGPEPPPLGYLKVNREQAELLVDGYTLKGAFPEIAEKAITAVLEWERLGGSAKASPEYVELGLSQRELEKIVDDLKLRNVGPHQKELLLRAWALVMAFRNPPPAAVTQAPAATADDDYKFVKGLSLQGWSYEG